MHVEFDLSIHVVKNTGRSYLEIAPLAVSLYLKYMCYEIAHNISF